MPKRAIATDLNDGIHFLTLTVERWYYLFDRHDRWSILAESLRYCRTHKALSIYAFVFMLNHIHLIVQAPDTAGCVRDFKRHTTKQLRHNLAATEPAAHDLFLTADGGYAIWQPDNCPKPVVNDTFYYQKLKYLVENPVRKQYVTRPEHWLWSSANPDCPLQPDPIA